MTKFHQNVTETANFHTDTIQLKANYNRIRKNMIIKNIDYRKTNDAIEWSRTSVH